MGHDLSSVKRLFHKIMYSILYGSIVTVTRRFTRLSLFLKTSAYAITRFIHLDTFYGQRLLSLKNNGKVHLHLIVQYEKNSDFFGSNTGKYWTVTWYK